MVFLKLSWAMIGSPMQRLTQHGFAVPKPSTYWSLCPDCPVCASHELCVMKSHRRLRQTSWLRPLSGATSSTPAQSGELCVLLSCHVGLPGELQSCKHSCGFDRLNSWFAFVATAAAKRNCFDIRRCSHQQDWSCLDLSVCCCCRSFGS